MQPARLGAEGGGTQGGSVFRFSMNPAAIGITDGIQDAFAYLQQTWRMWLPVIVAIAACSFVVYAIVGPVDTSTIYHVDPDTNQIVWNQDQATGVLARFAAAGAVTGLAGLIGSWVFDAIAIGGLRHRPITLGGIVVRGLVAVAASLVVGVAFGCAAIILVIVTVFVTPIGVLLILAAVPLTIYVGIRIIFYSLAVFDGFGPIGALEESWRLSDGAVMRMLGWGLMAILISLAFGILAGVTTSIGGGLQPLGQALSTGVSTTGSCFTVFLMAVLYESQRARMDPNLYPYAPGAFYPAGPYPYGPGPYPAGPYASGPYAAGPYPGGPGPYAPGSYPGGPAWPSAPATPPPGAQGANAGLGQSKRAELARAAAHPGSGARLGQSERAELARAAAHPGSGARLGQSKRAEVARAAASRRPGWNSRLESNSGPAWPSYPPAYPNVPPAPGAGPSGWSSGAPGEPDQTPPSWPKPPDPPASS